MAFWGFLALGILVEWVVMYVSLRSFDALPSNIFLGNLIGLMPMAFVVWLFGTFMVNILNSMVPFCLLYPFSFVLITFFMWIVYDLKAWELVQYFLFRFLIISVYTATGFALMQ